jgi:hypothetical protein
MCLIACCTLSQQLFIIWRSISTETLITIINRSISIDMLYLHGGQCRYSVRRISIKKHDTFMNELDYLRALQL